MERRVSYFHFPFTSAATAAIYLFSLPGLKCGLAGHVNYQRRAVVVDVVSEFGGDLLLAVWS